MFYSVLKLDTKLLCFIVNIPLVINLFVVVRSASGFSHRPEPWHQVTFSHVSRFTSVTTSLWTEVRQGQAGFKPHSPHQFIQKSPKSQTELSCERACVWNQHGLEYLTLFSAERSRADVLSSLVAHLLWLAQQI